MSYNTVMSIRNNGCRTEVSLDDDGGILVEVYDSDRAVAAGFSTGLAGSLCFNMDEALEVAKAIIYLYDENAYNELD